jgi:hypothetical protein
MKTITFKPNGALDSLRKRENQPGIAGGWLAEQRNNQQYVFRRDQKQVEENSDTLTEN